MVGLIVSISISGLAFFLINIPWFSVSKLQGGHWTSILHIDSRLSTCAARHHHLDEDVRVAHAGPELGERDALLRLVGERDDGGERVVQIGVDPEPEVEADVAELERVLGDAGPLL